MPEPPIAPRPAALVLGARAVRALLVPLLRRARRRAARAAARGPSGRRRWACGDGDRRCRAPAARAGRPRDRSPTRSCALVPDGHRRRARADRRPSSRPTASPSWRSACALTGRGRSGRSRSSTTACSCTVASTSSPRRRAGARRRLQDERARRARRPKRSSRASTGCSGSCTRSRASAPGAEEVEVVYAFLERPDAPVSTLFARDDVPELEAELSAAIARIDAGEFVPTPSEFTCMGCPALDVVCAGPRLRGGGSESPRREAGRRRVLMAVRAVDPEARRRDCRTIVSSQMSNVAVVVEEEPPPGQPLLGLYQGVPLTRRTQLLRRGATGQDHDLPRPARTASYGVEYRAPAPRGQARRTARDCASLRHQRRAAGRSSTVVPSIMAFARTQLRPRGAPQGRAEARADPADHRAARGRARRRRDRAARSDNPLELLVSVMLSAQTTDVNVNRVTEKLFAEVPPARGLPRGAAGGARARHLRDRLLPAEGEVAARDDADPDRGATTARCRPTFDDAAAAARRRAQDGERRLGRARRRAGDRRRHARAAALAAARASRGRRIR